MKTLRGLFPKLIEPELLEHVAQRVVRRKRRRPDVAWFLLRRDEVLGDLRRRLADGAWHPTPWRPRPIRDPKPRVIAIAPIEDRIVHAALVNLLEPHFLCSLTHDAFACRPGFGTHRAVLQLQREMRRNRWFLHLDLRSYFPSICIETLRTLLLHKVDDERFLALVERILEVGRGFYDDPDVRRHARMDWNWPPKNQGLPIGALTSQLFAAHVYLSAFDHYVKRELKVPGYVRYVDDLFFFGISRSQLTAWRKTVTEWLWNERSLLLKSPFARPRCCTGVLNALGRMIRRDGIDPLPRAWNRWRSSLAQSLYYCGRDYLRPDSRCAIPARVGHLLFP